MQARRIGGDLLAEFVAHQQTRRAIGPNWTRLWLQRGLEMTKLRPNPRASALCFLHSPQILESSWLDRPNVAKPPYQWQCPVAWWLQKRLHGIRWLIIDQATQNPHSCDFAQHDHSRLVHRCHTVNLERVCAQNNFPQPQLLDWFEHVFLDHGSKAHLHHLTPRSQVEPSWWVRFVPLRRLCWLSPWVLQLRQPSARR